MLYYFITLIIVIAIQYFLQIFLLSLGFSYVAIELIIDLVLAFIFSLLNYRGRKKDAFKDPRFHRNVAIYFGIFVIVALLFMQF
jgi:heme/copper-type cytochrome/quinol oxidase subunit 2